MGTRALFQAIWAPLPFTEQSLTSRSKNEDPGVVQVNIMEIFSDRITLTTKNYGEYTGHMENPAPSVLERYNGYNSHTDEPIKRVFVLS